MKKPEPIPLFARPADVSAELVDIDRKSAEIAAELTAHRAELGELVSARQAAEIPNDPDPAAVRVAAILGEQIAPRDTRDERIGWLRTRIADLTRAQTILYGKRREALTRASVVIRERVAPEYRVRVRKVADAFKAVHTATAELRALIDALEREGVSWGSLGVVFPPTGPHRDPNSIGAAYFRELVAGGFITRAEVPEGWQ